MNQIFVSCCQSDEPYAAAFITARLRERLAAVCTVFDHESMPPGAAGERLLWDATAIVAVIGDRWKAPAELALAFECGVPVIPVLIDGAAPPPGNPTAPWLDARGADRTLRLDASGVERGLRQLYDTLASLARPGTTPTAMIIEADEPDVLRTAITTITHNFEVRPREHGALVLALAGVKPITLISDLIPALRQRLPGHGRVRAAVDRGRPPLRLLAAPVLTRIFTAAPSARLAVLVSEEYYREVVVPAYETVDASTFGRVRAADNTTDEVAWAWVPGASAPPRSVIVPPPAQQGRDQHVYYGTGGQ